MDHHDIVRSCEEDFLAHGDTFLGAGWTKEWEQAERRYAVMLDVAAQRHDRATLLDFGCGPARLLDHIRRNGVADLLYSGLDLSARVIERCQSKYPEHTFHCLDVLADDSTLPEYDYVVLNGVFHWKGEIGQQQMFDYFCLLLETMMRHTRQGLAFNVMSKHVEWERDDLFHLPMQQATDFIAANLSRRFVIRQDYGLYEYTMYVYR